MRLNKISGIALVLFFIMFNIDLNAKFTISPCDDPDNVTNFINPPSDMTITCEEWSTFVPPTLSYTNNQNGECEISGSVSATVTGSQNFCGGLATYNWEFTDVCGRSISHIQDVTVEPSVVVTFINPPTNLTINCNEIETFSPSTLTYTNGSDEACLIEGTVEAIVDGTFDICGSTVTHLWEFVDDCGRIISHSQTVSLSPIPEASFIDPPINITISCEEWSTFIPSTLSYTNNQNGACEISGSVLAFTTLPPEPCGNDISYIWEFTDLCGRVITHAQVITIETALSANSISKDNIQIYPNPTNNLLNIKSEDNITALKLYTMTGNNLFQSLNTNINNSEIDLSLYPPGLYFLQVETENGRWVEKVIKK